MERLVVLWCPGLSREGPRSEEARAFAEVLDLLSERCPFVEPVRLGLAALPARAPSRFFGGEEAFLSLLRDDLEMFGHRHATPLLFGIADGLFASVLAARSESIVQSGETKEFLSGFSIATLRRPELAGICQRLGLSTLGRFAGLPPERVLERFGLDGAHCQRVARGQEGELLGIRDRAILHINPKCTVHCSMSHHHRWLKRRSLVELHTRINERLEPLFDCNVDLGRVPCSSLALAMATILLSEPHWCPLEAARTKRVA